MKSHTKKAYGKPELVRYGTIEAITQGPNQPAGADATSFTSKSG